MIAIVCVFSVLFGLAVGTITTAVIVADRSAGRRKPTYVFRDAPDPDYYFEPISARSIDKAMEIMLVQSMDNFGDPIIYRAYDISIAALSFMKSEKEKKKP